jgi:[ribosomal protein S18]-alanine N-acetyltransferase
MEGSDPAIVTFAQANEGHAAAIAAIHKQHFSPAWDLDSTLGLLQHPASLSLVAQSATPPDVIGYILGHSAAGEAEILSIGVSSGWLRRGIGAQLLSRWSALARGQGATRLLLEVGTGNKAAIALYRSQGFNEVGRRKGYYDLRPDGMAHDALILAKIP